jgi:hypothetical protein
MRVRVLCKNPMTGRFANVPRAFRSKVREQLCDLVAIGRDEHFPVGFQKLFDSLPAIRN